MAIINGMFQRQTVRDRSGSTDNFVGGYGNTVRFVGDKGANTFTIQGGAHNVEINNLGRDDRVNLQGPGWTALADSNPCDGVVRYYNHLNGSYAEVRTDGGRDDAFVRARVNGADSVAFGGAWNNLGHMDYATAAYMAGLQQGYRAGYQNGFGDGSAFGYGAGRLHGRMDMGAAFLAVAALGPAAWFLR